MSKFQAFPTISPADLERVRAKDASWSTLKFYDKSPAHYLHAVLNPPERTPAMLIGSALHCRVLEPDKFPERYAVAPSGLDRRTKAGKEAWAAFEAESAGKEILTADQAEQVEGMAAALLAPGSVSAKLLARCEHREQTIRWNDLHTGLSCKGVVDAFGEDFALDIKTTDDASSRAFSRALYNYQYHGQAAFYVDGLRLNGCPVSNFLFIVVEKTPPFGICAYACTEEVLGAGRLLYQRLLDLHSTCLAAEEWPGYPNMVQEIELPAWAA